MPEPMTGGVESFTVVASKDVWTGGKLNAGEGSNANHRLSERAVDRSFLVQSSEPVRGDFVLSEQRNRLYFSLRCNSKCFCSSGRRRRNTSAGFSTRAAKIEASM